LIALHDILHISVRQVFRQRRRSLGVLLAVALGTSSLITMLTLGDQLKQDMNRDLDLLGGATVILAGFTTSTDTTAPRQSFLPETVAAIRALPEVDSVSVATEYVDWLAIYWRGKTVATPLLGVDEHYWHTSISPPSKDGSLALKRWSRAKGSACLARSWPGTSSAWKIPWASICPSVRRSSRS